MKSGAAIAINEARDFRPRKGMNWGNKLGIWAGAMQEFYLIAPIGYPLPSNIVTNQ